VSKRDLDHQAHTGNSDEHTHFDQYTHQYSHPNEYAHAYLDGKQHAHTYADAIQDLPALDLTELRDARPNRDSNSYSDAHAYINAGGHVLLLFPWE